MADTTFKLRDLGCSADPTHPVVLDAWTRRTDSGVVETRDRTTGEVLEAMCAECGARLEHVITRLNLGGVGKKTANEAAKTSDYPGRDFPVATTEKAGEGVELVRIDRGDRVSTVFTPDGRLTEGRGVVTHDKLTGEIEVGVVRKVETVSTDADGVTNTRLHVEPRFTATPKLPEN
jgi:hypothetical protein